MMRNVKVIISAAILILLFAGIGIAADENEPLEDYGEYGALRNDLMCVTYTFISPTSGGVFNQSPTLRIRFVDITGGINNALYNLDICGGAWNEIWSHNCGVTDTTVDLVLPSVAAGAHNVYIKVFDDASVPNGDTCTHYWSFTYDPGSPSAEILSPPSGQGFTDLPTLTIHFHDEYGINNASYGIDGPGEPWQNFWSYNSLATDTVIYWNVPAVSEGQHSLYLKVTDDAGNANADSSVGLWSFTYDFSEPVVAVLDPLPGQFFGEPPSLSIHFNDNLGLNRAYYQIGSCEGEWLPLWEHNSGADDTTIVWTPSGLEPGLYHFYFKVIDDIGNVNPDSCVSSWSMSFGPTISLEPGHQLTKCNNLDTIWVDVSDNAVDIKAAFFRIGYDANYVTPVTVIAGPDLIPAYNFIIYSNILTDSVLVSLAALSGDFDGPGIMLGIVISPVAEVTATMISIDSSIFRNIDNQNIPHEIAGGSAMQVDCTRPSVIVNSPPSDGIYSSLPTLSIHFQDDLSLYRGYYQFDGCTGSWIELWPGDCSVADTSINWTIPEIPEGTHTIYFAVADDAGNFNLDSCVYGWSFGYYVPGIAMTPETGLSRCAGTDTLWIYADDDVSNVKAAHFRIGYESQHLSITGVIAGPALDPPSNYIIYPNVFPDSVLISMAALTGEFYGPGNMVGIIVSPVSEVIATTLSIDSCIFRNPQNQNIPTRVNGGSSIRIDCTLPSISVASPATGQTFSTLPTLSILSSDDHGLGFASYQIGSCSGTWTDFWSYNSGTTDTAFDWTVPAVTEGHHTVYFKVEDDAGNSNANQCIYSWNFTYDITPPTVEVLSPPSGGSYVGVLPELNILFRDNLELHLAFFQIDGYQGPWTPFWTGECSAAETTIVWTAPEISPGIHRIYFLVIDEAGLFNEDILNTYWQFTYSTACDCTPGDANGSQSYNILDATYVLSYLYKGGPAPITYEYCSGDANCNCVINILDVTYLLSYLYKSGTAPCSCDEWIQNCGPLRKKGW